MTIRAILTGLVLSVVVPLGLVAAAGVYYVHETRQRQFKEGLAEAARALALVVESEIAQRETVARTLAHSPALQRGDLKAFYDYARQVAPHPSSVVVLAELDGRQLLNTRRPLGDPLPRTVFTGERLLQSPRGALVTDLYFAPLGQQHSFAVGVPALRDGKPAYLVAYAGYSSALQRVFEAQKLPPSWTAAILDSEGIIAARNAEAGRFVGKPAVPELREAIRQQAQGMLESRTKAGEIVLAAFGRTPTYGWTLAIGVPQSQMGSALGAAAAVGGFALLVLLLSLWAAAHLGRRMVRPVEGIGRAAERMAAGERIEAHLTGLVEIDTVQRVLAQASEAIASASDEMRKRVQDAVAEADRAHQVVLQSQRLEALGQLTGGVAHDFNNLLMVVSNYAFLLKTRYPELGQSKEIAGIERSVSTGSKLTRQLLAFARRQAVRPEPLALQERLPEIAALVKASMGSNIHVHCEVPEEALVVVADPAEFELALINLAVNARDAMPGGGTLTIAAQRDAGDRVALAVHDTGAGIPADLIAKVFEPFFTTKAVGHGTGLGLSQVYGFAKQAGGEARIASAPGHGTTVTLLLPLAPADAFVAADAQADAPARGHGEQVLMVEDNAELGSVTEQVLGRAGFRVTRATDAQQALDLLQAHSFDLVLSDVRMPGQRDGIALAEWILAHRAGLPVILTTGYSEHIARAQALQLPVLAKPTPPDVLLGEVRRLLDARRGLTGARR